MLVLLKEARTLAIEGKRNDALLILRESFEPLYKSIFGHQSSRYDLARNAITYMCWKDEENDQSRARAKKMAEIGTKDSLRYIVEIEEELAD